MIHFWLLAFVVALAQEVLVVAPIKTLVLHTIGPALIEAPLIKADESEPMDYFTDAMSRGLDLHHAAQLASRGGMIDPDLARALGIAKQRHVPKFLEGGVELDPDALAERGAAAQEGQEVVMIDYDKKLEGDRKEAARRREVIKKRQAARKRKKKLTLRERLRKARADDMKHHAKKKIHWDLPHLLNWLGETRNTLLTLLSLVGRLALFGALVAVIIGTLLASVLLLFFSDNYFMQ